MAVESIGLRRAEGGKRGARKGQRMQSLEPAADRGHCESGKKVIQSI